MTPVATSPPQARSGGDGLSSVSPRRSGVLVTEPTRARAWLALGALLVVAVVLRLVFFTGFVGSDDSDYLDAAVKLAERGQWRGQDLASSRIGFVGAIAATMRIFGSGEVATVSLPLAASLATHVLVYALGALYFGRGIALLAVALLAPYPLNVVFSTILVPETLLSCLMAGGLLAYEVGARSAGSRRSLLALAAGVLLGLAYLVKEPGALLLAALMLSWLADAIARRRLQPIWLAVVVGFVAVLTAEMLVGYLASGSAFARLHISADSTVLSAAISESEREARPWGVYPRSMFFSIYAVGFFFYLVIAALVWSSVRGLRLPRLLLLWLAVLLGFLAFGSVSLTSYAPLPKQPRYLEAVTVPAVLLCAPFVHRLLSVAGGLRRALVGLALATYIASAILCAAFTSSIEQSRFSPIRSVTAFLATQGLTPLYASPRVADGLFQLSGTRWPVRQIRSQACGPNTPASMSVWSARSPSGVPSPDSRCDAWAIIYRLQVAPSAFARASLTFARRINDSLAGASPLTAKVARTIARHEMSGEIKIFTFNPDGTSQ